MLSIGRLFGLIVLFLFFEVVVWILGTLLLPDANPLWVCAALTAMALVVWIVYVVVNRWMSRPHAPAPPAPGTAPVVAPAVPPSAETKDLKLLIHEAEDRLAASSGFSRKGARPRLDQLPIYLLVGTSGSGKTSSFANSGLDPRLLAGESYRDTIVVPTKLCNIWYAGDAIWIDVSGKLFDDDAAWRGLLNLLTGREEKPWLRRLWEGRATQQNLRGAVLFCDANVFLRSPDPQQTAALSRRLQERLQAVGQVIGAEFPVYTVFSKSDTIPYFGDFFNQLSEQEDRQVLGFTLPSGASVVKTFGEVYTEAENRRLSDYWTRLYQSLSDKRLTFLGREANPEKKPFIYEFPREVKRIRAEVVRFLVDTFRPNPLQPGPQLRGFYLSGIRKVVSARTAERLGDQTQSKVSSDATVLFKAGDLSQMVAAATARRPVVAQAEATVPRWIFLSDVLHRIVLGDRTLGPAVSVDYRTERQRYLAFGSIAVVSLLLAVAFTTSWVNNQRLLEDIRTAVGTANASDSQNPLSRENLQSMETLRAQLARLTGYDRDRTPWKLSWGLYTGNAVLADLRRAYFARFRQAFLDPILTSLPRRFSSLNPASASDSYGGVYDSVKVYRTITSGACKPDQELLGKMLPGLATEGRSLNPRDADLAQQQINFYISELMVGDPYEKSLKEDGGAIQQAQAYLRGLKGPEQFYRGLITGVNQSDLPGAKLANYTSGYADVLTGPTEVPASFTRQGWDAVQRKISEGKLGTEGESCVAGNRALAMAQGLSDPGAVQSLYVAEYMKRWQEFLSQQGIVRYRDTADAVQKLDVLSGNRSPLLAVLFMVAENTNFASTQTGTTASAPVEKATNSLKAKFSSLLSRGKKVQDLAKQVLPTRAAQLSQADVFAVFQPVRAVVNPINRERLVDDPNRNYINALADLKAALDGFPRDHNANIDNAVIDRARAAADKAHAAVREMGQRFNIASAKGTDEIVTQYLSMPIESAERLIPAPVDPSAKVNGQMKLVCDSLRLLKQKYPFNPKAEPEASVQELIKLFAPNTGLMWSFQSLPQLPALLVQAGDQWIQNPAVPQPKLTPEFLEFFNRMAHISSALFTPGSFSPRLQYTVQPMPVEGVQEVNVTVDGVPSTTSHPVQSSWPAPTGASSVEVRLTINGVGVPFGRYEDIWAIFRLMDDAEPRAPGQNVFTFRSLRQGRGRPQEVTGTNGQPVAVRLMITFTGGFDPRNFNVSCPRIAAQ